MYSSYLNQDRPRSALEEYCRRMGQIIERDRAQSALVIAKQDAEHAAELAHEAMLEAQTADRSKSEFLATISHELKTPLNSIIGFSDAISSGHIAETESQIQEYGQNILDSGRHLLAIISDILDMARIDVGRIELRESDAEFAAIVETCFGLVKGRAVDRDIRLEARIPDDLPRLFVDEQRIKQVLVNLLSNAIKFTSEGGKASVAAWIEEDGRFVFEVADSGIGIADRDIAKILQPFSQADGRLSRKYEGVGLGLPIAGALVKLHGGELVISGVPDQGTSVKVYLPVERIKGKQRPN